MDLFHLERFPEQVLVTLTAFSALFANKPVSVSLFCKFYQIMTY